MLYFLYCAILLKIFCIRFENTNLIQTNIKWSIPIERTQVLNIHVMYNNYTTPFIEPALPAPMSTQPDPPRPDPPSQTPPGQTHPVRPTRSDPRLRTWPVLQGVQRIENVRGTIAGTFGLVALVAGVSVDERSDHEVAAFLRITVHKGHQVAQVICVGANERSGAGRGGFRVGNTGEVRGMKFVEELQRIRGRGVRVR